MTSKPTIIRGVVQDRNGNPIAGARAYFIAGPVALPDIAAVTDEDGRFTLTSPANGSYQIGCATDQASTSVKVEVAGHDLDIEIRLPR